MVISATAFLLSACGDGEPALEVTIASPTEGEVLREEPFLVTGAISSEPPKSGVWLLVGSVADERYYPVRSIAVNANRESAGGLPWSARFYTGVCEESFIPGDREVMLVRTDADLLADIADSLALKQPMSRSQLEGHLLATVVVDIQKPERDFCLEAAPTPTDGGTPPEGSP